MVERRGGGRTHAFIALAFAAVLAACTAPQRAPPSQDDAAPPADASDAYYRDAAARGGAVYRIDPAQSLVVVEVRRGGALARFGHDHVVAGRDVSGYIALDAGRADLLVPLARLSVDEAALRAEAGLDTRPSESDIAGTRANMLDKVLEVDRFPNAIVQVRSIAGGGATRDVAITLRGVTRRLQLPVQVEPDGKDLVATGRLAFNQSDFGIAPFSILGGAIQVQDRVELRFRIHAARG